MSDDEQDDYYRRIEAMVEQLTAQRVQLPSHPATTGRPGDVPACRHAAAQARFRRDGRAGGLCLMAWRKSRRAAELVKRLERLDFRSESLGPALKAMACDAERTTRRLAQKTRV